MRPVAICSYISNFALDSEGLCADVSWSLFPDIFVAVSRPCQCEKSNSTPINGPCGSTGPPTATVPVQSARSRDPSLTIAEVPRVKLRRQSTAPPLAHGRPIRHRSPKLGFCRPNRPYVRTSFPTWDRQPTMGFRFFGWASDIACARLRLAWIVGKTCGCARTLRGCVLPARAVLGSLRALPETHGSTLYGLRSALWQSARSPWQGRG